MPKYGILRTRKVAEMTNYRAILLYYSKGNTMTQIATICDCSRTTVIRAVKRAKAIGLALPVSDKIKDEELYFMLYPKRGPKKEYYRPDFYLLNKDKKKRGFTKYRAWQKYCRVAKREGYKAYGKSRFYKMYKDRSMPIKRITVKGDRESKNPLVFNTEAMKEKYPIEVTEDINGEAISEDVFREIVSLCRYF